MNGQLAEAQTDPTPASPHAEARPGPGSRDRLEVVDALRGIAALAVAWFHFTNGNPDFLPAGALKRSGSAGWVGVEMFFVISGFIVPYSMRRSGYVLSRDFGRFIGRRMVRLDPPYLVAIVLTVALAFVSAAIPGYRGDPPHYTAVQLLAHLGYLNSFLGYVWVSPVFWTLAIEFQYYLLVALLMSLLAHPSPRVRLGLVAALCVAPFMPLSNNFIVPFLPLFAMGMVTFQYWSGFIARWQFLLLVPIVSAFCLVRLGATELIAGLATALCIAFVRIKVGRWLTFAGLTSYSLYLFHVPVGGRVISLAMRMGPALATKLVALAVAMSASMFAAYVMYRAIELPAQRWSRKIGYASRGTLALVDRQRLP